MISDVGVRIIINPSERSAITSGLLAVNRRVFGQRARLLLCCRNRSGDSPLSLSFSLDPNANFPGAQKPAPEAHLFLEQMFVGPGGGMGTKLGPSDLKPARN